MKKYLYAAGVLALGLASCTSDETLEQNTVKDQIRFKAYVAGVTRADEGEAPATPERIHNRNSSISKITVNATSEAGENFIKGDEYDLKDDAWGSGAKYFWPKGKVTFQSLYDGFTPGDEITVTDPTTQADYLYAVTVASKEQVDGDKKITLNFRHALAQVAVKANKTDANMKVAITSVALKNVYGKGTYTLPTTTTKDNVDGTYVEANRGKWALAGNADNSYTVSKSVSLTGDAAVLADELLVIPNTGLSAYTETVTAGSYIELVAKVTYKVGEADEYTIHNGKIAVPVALNMVEGKKYTYTVSFGEGEGGIDPENPGKDIFVKVKLKATVDNFTAADKTIDVQ